MLPVAQNQNSMRILLAGVVEGSYGLRKRGSSDMTLRIHCDNVLSRSIPYPHSELCTPDF